MTEKQKLILFEMLYDGRMIKDCAEALGVHRVTVWRWMRKRKTQIQYDRYARKRYAGEKRKQLEKDGYYERLRKWQVSVRKQKRRLNRARESGCWAQVEKAYEAYTIVMSERPYR